MSTGHFFSNLLHFGRVLRGLGLDVQAGRMLDVADALTHIDIARRSDFYFTLRTLLVRRAQDLSVFDHAFHLFWRPPPTSPPAPGQRSQNGSPHTDSPEDDSTSGRPTNGSSVPGSEALLEVKQVMALSYSADQVSRNKDFATFTETEIAQARAMLASLKWELGTRTTKRWRPRGDRTVDLRRIIRQNLRYGGEVLILPKRRRRTRPRPLVLLCDVSGSMERYSRMLLHFMHTLAGSFDHGETFLFSTGLTRVTRQLARRGVDDVVPTLPRHVPNWAGGTRIGNALRTFNTDWARRVRGHAPVVLLISDGWDRGAPEQLGAEMARLQRSCYRLIWLNPLLGSPQYRPLTKGMQAALPWIDDFLPVHNLASLDALAAHLNCLSAHRSTRRQVMTRSTDSGRPSQHGQAHSS